MVTRYHGGPSLEIETPPQLALEAKHCALGSATLDGQYIGVFERLESLVSKIVPVERHCCNLRRRYVMPVQARERSQAVDIAMTSRLLSNPRARLGKGAVVLIEAEL